MAGSTNKPMEVPIGSSKVDDLIEKMKEAKSTVTALDDAVKKLNVSLKGTSIPKGAASGNGNFSGSPSVGGSPAPSGGQKWQGTANWVNGGNAGFAPGTSNNGGMGAGGGGGNGGNSNSKGGGKNPQSWQSKAFNQTRFNIGGASVLGTTIRSGAKIAAKAMGYNPAIVDSAIEALGPEAYVAYKVAQAGYSAVNAASSSIAPVSDTYYRSGGTAKESAIAAALSGGDAGRPESFADSLRKGGYGSAYFRQHGFTDIGQYQANKATNYIEALDYFRHDQNLSRDERTRIGRSSGFSTREMMLTDPDLLGEDAFRALKDSYGAIGTRSAIRSHNEYETSKEATSNAWSAIVAKTLGPTMQSIAEATTGFATSINEDSSLMDNVKGMYHTLRGLNRAVPSPVSWLWGLLPDWKYDDQKSPASSRSGDSSINGYRESRQEIIGGGSRTRSTPIGMNYGAVVNGTENEVYRLGAF